MSEENEKPGDESALAPAAKRRKRRFGRLLLIAGPITVAVVSAYLYWTGGRYVSTDNAYVQADKVVISAEVSGPITAVRVVENQEVKKGQSLFEIDDRSYTNALVQARARLQEVLADIQTRKASYRQKENELKLAQSDLDFARKEYRRQLSLEHDKAVSKAKLDAARHTLEVNRQRLDVIKDQMAEILAQLEGDPKAKVDRLAEYRLAKGQLDQAALDLSRTTVRAPFAGRISKIPQPGTHVEPGSPVMSLIADHRFWIEANIKETGLTHVRTGQKVHIEVDAYPNHAFSGQVTSISPATGSEFSIIPAQNASGNWVKVVQRIPVRIAVNDPFADCPLRAGMSTSVSIDTKHHRALPAVVRWGIHTIGLDSSAAATPPAHKQ